MVKADTKAARQRKTRHRTVGAVCLYLVVIMVAVGTLQAQRSRPAVDPPMASPFESQNLPTLLGLTVGFDFSSHSGHFVLADTGGVRQYTTSTGNGGGIHGMLSAFVPLTSWLYLSPRLGMEGLGGVLSAGTEMRSILADDQKLHDASLEHSIDISMSTLHLDLLLAPVLFHKPLIYVDAGASLATPLSCNYFSYETISGASYHYSDGLTTRNMAEGKIDSHKSFIPSLQAGLGTLVALRKFIVQVEAQVEVPLTQYTSDPSINWTTTRYLIHIGLVKII